MLYTILGTKVRGEKDILFGSMELITSGGDRKVCMLYRYICKYIKICLYYICISMKKHKIVHEEFIKLYIIITIYMVS